MVSFAYSDRRLATKYWDWKKFSVDDVEAWSRPKGENRIENCEWLVSQLWNWEGQRWWIDYFQPCYRNE